jgi:hypothetical protein
MATRRTGARDRTRGIPRFIGWRNGSGGVWAPGSGRRCGCRGWRGQDRARPAGRATAAAGFALLGSGAAAVARDRFGRALRLARDGGYQYYEAQAGIGTDARAVFEPEGAYAEPPAVGGVLSR